MRIARKKFQYWRLFDAIKGRHWPVFCRFKAGFATIKMHAIKTFTRRGETTAQSRAIFSFGQSADCTARAGIGIGPADFIDTFWLDYCRWDSVANRFFVGKNHRISDRDRLARRNRASNQRAIRHGIFDGKALGAATSKRQGSKRQDCRKAAPYENLPVARGKNLRPARQSAISCRI